MQAIGLADRGSTVDHPDLHHRRMSHVRNLSFSLLTRAMAPTAH
jgi:hypothetical protein